MLPKKVNLAILALLVFEAQSPGSREKRVLWGFQKYHQPVEGPLKSPYIVNVNHQEKYPMIQFLPTLISTWFWPLKTQKTGHPGFFGASRFLFDQVTVWFRIARAAHQNLPSRLLVKSPAFSRWHRKKKIALIIILGKLLQFLNLKQGAFCGDSIAKPHFGVTGLVVIICPDYLFLCTIDCSWMISMTTDITYIPFTNFDVWII